MWIKRALLLLGFPVLLTGCSLLNPFGRPSGTGATPEEAVLAARSNGGFVRAQSVEVLGMRDVDGRKVVMFRAQGNIDSPDVVVELGYGVAEPDGAGWKAVLSQGNLLTTPQAIEEHAPLLSWGHTRPPDPQTWAFGTASAVMTRAEATLGNGDVLSDTVTNGVFMMFRPIAAEVCEVRFLGANGAVLRREDTLGVAPPDPQTPNPCPR